MEEGLKGYVLAIINVHDKELFKEYTNRTPIAVKKYHGRFLSRGTDYAIMEGKSEMARIVLLEFSSYAIAQEFYHSPEYQDAAQYRRRSAQTEFFIMNGYNHNLIDGIVAAKA